MKKIIIILDNHYFDLTEYSKLHPGGSKILKKFHLKDATNEFNKFKGHADSYVIDSLDEYCIGHVDDININDYL